MDLFAVAGRPILHSRSPELFRHLFRRQDPPAAYSRIRASSPEEALGLMRRLHMHGLNITAPLKEEMLPCLERLDATARRIGGVNLVKASSRGLRGGNSDPTGVCGPLAARNIRLRGMRALVLGAGGAARAAVFALTAAGARVIVANRTAGRAEALARRFGCLAVPLGQIADRLSDCDLLLSTLPAAAAAVRPEWLRPGLIVFDADYRSGALYRSAAAAGCRAIPGEEWLVHQALQSFLWLTGRRAPVRDARLLAVASERPRKANVALVGFMACGKSTIARRLARRLDFRLFDSDAEIEHAEGMSVAAIFKRRGEAYFRRREREMVSRLAGMRNVVFASGGGAILGAQNRAVLRAHAWTVWPVAGLETTRRRLRGGTRPLLEGTRIAERTAELFFARKELYFSTAELIVDGENDAGELAEAIHDEIRFAIQN